MTTPFDMRADAITASDAARRIAHATHPASNWPGVEFIGDVYDTVGRLDGLAGSLNQALTQAASYVRTEAAADRLRQGHGRRAHVTAETAAVNLDAAAQAFAEARHFLAQAQAHLSPLAPAEVEQR
ncbi:hypothetical protein ACFQ6V_30840 [Streptomyces roseifaciens]